MILKLKIYCNHAVAVKVVPMCRWVDNIKIDLKETGWEGMDCIDLAQDRGNWWALSNETLGSINARIS